MTQNQEEPRGEPSAGGAPGVTPSPVSRVILAVLMILYAWWFTHHSLDRWAAMHTSLDFVHLDSAAYNTAHGKFMFSNAKMINFWAEHISPVLLGVSAFYLFSDSYWFIFFYQSASIALAAAPLFLLARHHLKREPAALLFSMGYLANGMIQRANLFDYHEYAHTGLFFFGALYAAARGRWRWYAACCAGILMVKEDGFVTLASAGLYAAASCRAYRQAALTWAACAAAAAIEFGAIYPWLRAGEAYKYDTYYAWMGATAADKAANVLGHPLRLATEALSNPARAGAWWNMILGFGALPVLSPLGAAMLFLPSMELFLSWYRGAHGLSFHYPLLVIPMWTAAAILGTANLARLAARVSPGRMAALVAIIAPLYILAGNVWQARDYGGAPFISNPSWEITQKQRDHAEIVREALKIIPHRATVSAHDGPYSFLTHNPNAYLYHGEKTGHVIVEFFGGKMTRGYLMWPFGAMDVEYIVLDANAPFQVRAIQAWDVEDVKTLPEYELILERDGLFIFRLRDKARGG